MNNLFSFINKNPVKKAEAYRERGLYENLFQYTEKQLIKGNLTNFERGSLFYERGLGFFIKEEETEAVENFREALSFLFTERKEEKGVIASIYFYLSEIKALEQERDKNKKRAFFLYKKLLIKRMRNIMFI